MVSVLARIPARHLVSLLVVSFLIWPAAAVTVAKSGLPARAGRTNAAPVPSGAEAAYPLNHSLDTTGGTIGTPPANHDFETAPVAVGTPPANHEFTTGPTTVGTPPTNHAFDTGATPIGTPPQNHDFAAGSFTGWTTTGSPTIVTDATQGSHASLGSGATITTAAFSIDTTAQVVTLKVKGLTGGTDQYRVSVLSGMDFSTSTQLISTSAVDNWTTLRFAVAGYQGQQIKLKVERLLGTVGVDDAGVQSIDLPNWTVTGTPGIATDAAQGGYASLGADATITSAAFTIDSTSQVLSLKVTGLATGSDQFKVFLLSGPAFATSTQLTSTIAADGWTALRYETAPWLGQAVKLRLERSLGTVGFDDVGLQTIEAPSWAITGLPLRGSDAGNPYIDLGADGSLTSTAFTVDGAAQVIALRLKGLTMYADSYEVNVLSGAGFATTTQVLTGSVDDSWTTLSFNAASYTGQQIKLQVKRIAVFGRIGVDDAGTQQIALPSWTYTGVPARLTGGPAGAYVRTNGQITSAAFTVATGAQHVSISYRGDSASASFYLELLRGADFSQVVNLSNLVLADQSQWNTFKAGVSLYAGETVKLRLRQHFGMLLFDTVGPMEQLLPGWSLNSSDAVAIGEDANGTYATPVRDSVSLRSSTIQSGVIDRAGKVDQRYFAVSYEIGTLSASFLYVRWHNTTGQNWPVQQDSASTPTGYRTRYFPVYDYMGQQGYFVVQVTGGRLYSLADNVARQQLAEPFSRKAGLHIDTSTGGFGFSATDVVDLSPGLPLTFSRYHHAHSDRIGTLGYRWSHSYDTRLVVTDDGDAGVVYGDGREAFFDGITATTFEPADTRVKDALVENGDGTYTLTRTSNHSYRFAADGRLLSITDKNSNALTPTYDGQGRVTTVTGPGGATLTFAYNAGGRLATVTDPGGGVTTYTYSMAGDLATAQNPTGGTVTYTYSQHRLAQVTDELGQTLIANTLDSVHRVTTQTDAAGKTIQFAYDTPSKGATRVTDPNSNAAFYYYDGWHRTTDRQDPLGRVETHHYDTAGNLQRIVDPALNEWEFAYDASGMLTQATDPNTFTIQLTYDAKHLPTTVKDGRGNITTLLYDTAGNVIKKTEPMGVGGVWEYTYDSRGNLLTEQNPLNQTTTSTYNTRNQQTSKTDPLGHTWTWTYDDLGRKTAETNPLGQATTYTYDLFGRMLTRTDALSKTTTYVYNARGLLVTETDPLGQVTTYAYNSRHLLASRTDPAGKVWSYTYDDNRNRLTETNPLNQTTTYAYDDANRLITVTDPLGRVTTTTYDTAGRVATEQDPLSRTTSYTYDDAGRLLTETLPNGGVTTSTYDADGNQLTERNALNQTTTYEYDALSRQTKITNPMGHITTYAYDAAGRTTIERDPLNQTITRTYDAAGRLTSLANPLMQTTTYAYDNADRLTTTTDPLGRVTTYSYDAVGRPTATTDPGGVPRSMTYDSAGRLTGRTTPSGTTTMTYDARGLKLTETNPLGHVRSYAYDDAGRMTSETDPLLRTTGYLYDAAGQRTRITDALGGTVQFTYDAAGQELTVTNPRGKTATYTYDSLGNILTERDPLNRTTTNVHDLLGRITSTTDPRGIVVGAGYDGAGRVTGATYPGGSITYTHDTAGQRTGMTDATGTTTWSYDAAGRTTAVAAPQGTVSYTYTAAGERTSMTLPGSRTVSYTYDATTGRLTSLTDWAARTTSFGYDTEGRRSTFTRPNGVVTTMTFDAAGRKTGVSHTDVEARMAAVKQNNPVFEGKIVTVVLTSNDGQYFAY